MNNFIHFEDPQMVVSYASENVKLRTRLTAHAVNENENGNWGYLTPKSIRLRDFSTKHSQNISSYVLTISEKQ